MTEDSDIDVGSLSGLDVSIDGLDIPISLNSLEVY